MPKQSRWTAEKRFEIVMEVLRKEESIAQIARRYQVKDKLLYRWRDRFFEGGKSALCDGGGVSDKNRSALQHQVDELQKLIGEQTVEIRFLKKLSRS
jgi:transposase-like protein